MILLSPPPRWWRWLPALRAARLPGGGRLLLVGWLFVDVLLADARATAALESAWGEYLDAARRG